MNIRVVRNKISINEIKEIGREFYDFMIKGVIDIEQEIVALGGEYHMDANVILLEQGSKQENIWGFNIHFHKTKDSPDWIEYISLINIRPHQNNREMEIKDKILRKKIRKILEKLIE